MAAPENTTSSYTVKKRANSQQCKKNVVFSNMKRARGREAIRDKQQDYMYVSPSGGDIHESLAVELVKVGQEDF